MDFDVEGEAAWLLKGFDGVPGARALIKHHLGSGSVVVLAGLSRDGMLAKVNGTWRIYIRARLTSLKERWTLLHELAEWQIKNVGYQGPDIETCAEALAGAVAVPRSAYLSRRDTAWPAIAADFAVTQTCAILRHGEVTGESVAVATPRKTFVRGSEIVLPTESQLRRFVKTNGFRLTDADRRHGIIF